MNHEPKVREMERAAIERWFAHSPLGTLFVARDGRMLQIRADAVAATREEAFARIDRYLIEARPPPQGAMLAVILIFTCILFALDPLLHLGGGAIGGIVMAGVTLWHGHDVYLLWRYRRDLKELRARTAMGLALSTPVPAEIASRYRRTNPWRIALHVWVFGLIAIALLSTHFVPPETVSRGILLVAIAAVAVAWLLYFVSRSVDRAQAREAALASRPTPPISPA